MSFRWSESDVIAAKARMRKSSAGEPDLAGPVKLSKSKQIAEKFADQCAERALPDHEREFYFAKEIGRRWRFDFAWPLHRLAVEIEGLVVFRGWLAKLAGPAPIVRDGYVTNVVSVQSQMIVMGAHATITGFREDCEKYAWARALGWSVIRFEQSQVRDKFAIDMTARCLAAMTSTHIEKIIIKPAPRKKPEKFGTAPLF